MPETIIEISKLSLGYNGKDIIHDVNLKIIQGDFWCLIGPNGCGKSTLLKGIIATLPPRSGAISLNEKIADRKSIGFVPQKCDINATLPTTVREFVSLGTVGLGFTAGLEEENFGWAVERVGLGAMIGKSYWDLSGGQRQRALLARTLARRPKLIILDEPTNGLDIPAEESLLQTLESLNSENGITIMVVTHNLNIAMRFGRQFALFMNGTVLSGEGRDVITQSNIHKVYGGIPAAWSIAAAGVNFSCEAGAE